METAAAAFNRGWMSLPKALTAIIEASGKRRWVKHY